MFKSVSNYTIKTKGRSAAPIWSKEAMKFPFLLLLMFM